MLASCPDVSSEPFGYFKAEPFGWTDCAKDDEGAIALYEMPQPDRVAELQAKLKASQWKDHNTRELADKLTTIAIQFKDTQQLRAQISMAIKEYRKQIGAE
jgi:hypothetical protein